MYCSCDAESLTFYAASPAQDRQLPVGSVHRGAAAADAEAGDALAEVDPQAAPEADGAAQAQLRRNTPAKEDRLTGGREYNFSSG